MRDAAAWSNALFYRVSEEVLQALFGLAEEQHALEKMERMQAGAANPAPYPRQTPGAGKVLFNGASRFSRALSRTKSLIGLG